MIDYQCQIAKQAIQRLKADVYVRLIRYCQMYASLIVPYRQDHPDLSEENNPKDTELQV